MLDFLGIGAQKAATTWIYEQLARHRAVGFPAGKEVHFWDQQRDRGVDWWLGLFAGGAPGVRQGEITPAYSLLGRDDVVEIHRHRPDLRIFYSLRNPVQRAWSGALMALARAELEEEEVSDQWFIDHFRSRGSLGRGDYAGCLERWRSVFTDEQVLVILHDDIVGDPRTVLVALARHLAIEPGTFTGLPESDLRRPVLPGPGIPIRPTLLPVLREIYEPRVAALEKVLGRGLDMWRVVHG